METLLKEEKPTVALWVRNQATDRYDLQKWVNKNLPCYYLFCIGSHGSLIFENGKKKIGTFDIWIILKTSKQSL